MPMGVLAHRSARMLYCYTLCSALHQLKQQFFGACVCKVTFKYFFHPLISHIQSFRTLEQFLKTPTVQGVGRGV